LDNQTLLDPLSERELDVLRLLAENKSNREIGDDLFISAETVKWYNKQIYSKLDVSSRQEAVQKAHDLGLLERTSQADAAAADLQLPAQLTSFIGRDDEINEIKHLLGSNRLVTLTGPGGTGKTRLALQVVSESASLFSHGVLHVGLAQINDPTLVPSTISQALNLMDRDDKSVKEQLMQYLSNKNMLILLDNFEHLLEAAPLVGELLEAAPVLRIMTTSREVLHLYGEQEYAVPPLSMPVISDTATFQDLISNESVTLFTQRARAIDPGFQLTEEDALTIARICVRLDGLPLAIELAAARIRLFKPEQLLERLKDRLGLLTGGARNVPARQQTLRDTIDWSYNLLNEGEKKLFARLGAFVGGRSIDAVEAICRPGLPIDTFDGLESLLGKSLICILNQDPRFGMLDTIHEYARECLAKSGEEAEIRQRHLEFYVSLMEETAPGYRYQNQVILFKRTYTEMSNIRTAFGWAFDNGNYEAAARLLTALRDYYYYWGHQVEGIRLFLQTLPHAALIPETYRAPFLLAAGVVFWNHDIDKSEEVLLQALELGRQIVDRISVAWSLLWLAGAYGVRDVDKYELALGYAEEARSIFEEHGNRPGVAQALNIEGEICRTHGNYQRARKVYNDCLAIVEETGEVLRSSMMYANLGFVDHHAGDYEKAFQNFRHGLELAHQSGAKYMSVTGMAMIAGPLSQLGQAERAAHLLGASRALLEGIGIDHQYSDRHELYKYTDAVKAALDEETYTRAFEAGRHMSLDEAIAYALADEE